MQEKRSPEGSIVAGVILVAIGVIALASQLAPLAPWIVLATIAALFFALWATTHRYGFVIPGMIIGGLAIGTAWEDSLTSQTGGEVLVGLAAGFFGIYAVNLFSNMRASWWPLIPGSIIALIGGSLVLNETEYAELFGQLWPIALIAAGAVMLAGVFLGQRRPETPKT